MTVIGTLLSDLLLAPVDGVMRHPLDEIGRATAELGFSCHAGRVVTIRTPPLRRIADVVFGELHGRVVREVHAVVGKGVLDTFV